MTSAEYHEARQALRDAYKAGAINLAEKQAQVRAVRAVFLSELESAQ